MARFSSGLTNSSPKAGRIHSWRPFFVAYGELAIGLALTLGILVRAASLSGLIFMLTLLFSSDYPGSQAAFWQYFGASLSHSVFALSFGAFLVGRADEVWTLKALRKNRTAR